MTDFNLYDVYALTDGNAENLVVHVESIDVDENDEIELVPVLIPVEIDVQTGDRIVRIPAEDWARLPVETVIEIEPDEFAFEGEDFDEDETQPYGGTD